MRKLLLISIVIMLFLTGGCLPHTYEYYIFQTVDEDGKRNKSNMDYRIIPFDNFNLMVRIYETGKTIKQDKTIYHAPYFIRVGIIKSDSLENEYILKKITVNSIKIEVNENKTINFLYTTDKDWEEIKTTDHVSHAQELDLSYSEVRDNLKVHLNITLKLEGKDTHSKEVKINEVVQFAPTHDILKTTLLDRIGFL